MTYFGTWRFTHTTEIGGVDVDLEVEAELYGGGSGEDFEIDCEEITARLWGCEIPDDVVEALDLKQIAAETFLESAYASGSVSPGVYVGLSGEKVRVLEVAKAPDACEWYAMVEHLGWRGFRPRYGLLSLDQFETCITTDSGDREPPFFQRLYDYPQQKTV